MEWNGIRGMSRTFSRGSHVTSHKYTTILFLSIIVEPTWASVSQAGKRPGQQHTALFVL